MSAVSIDGITIGYDDVGRGEPLVLVHGHPFDRSMWRPQAELFGRTGWRVITPDLRGYGESSVVPGSTALATFAGDIARLLDHLEIDRIVLGGLSMGGQVVMEFHRHYADRIRGLVLADTSAAAETASGRKQRIDTADRLVRDGMAGYADEVLPKMVAPHNIRDLPAVARHVLGMMRASSPEGAAAALRGRAERRDYVESLGRIAVPTLVVVGRDDEFTPIADARLMHERIPDSRLVIVEGAGHLPNLERPGEFNEAMRRFLESLQAPDFRGDVVPAVMPMRSPEGESGRGLGGRGAVEHREVQDARGEATDRRDHEPADPGEDRRVAEGVVERDPARADRPRGDPDGGEDQVVLPAGRHDEEPVLAVYRPRRHQHQRDVARPGERGQQAGRQ